MTILQVPADVGGTYSHSSLLNVDQLFVFLPEEPRVGIKTIKQ